MKKEYISFEDTFYESGVCDIRENKENERFSRILEKLKQYDIIKSYKEFADNINETSVGLNDIKKGRKKLSVNHVKSINIKYPFINTDFILFDEGFPFYEEFLIAYYVEGKEFASYYKFDLDAINNYDPKTKDDFSIQDQKTSFTSKPHDNDLMKELLSTKDELLQAKDEILRLQTEIYELKLKSSK